ncbi:hypothetical protein BT69DRAFT_833957 [Atractiella rhizophila]|nr:hypothetical protein BT69DRAFT_833957 [Atractiella rhizophila]
MAAPETSALLTLFHSLLNSLKLPVLPPTLASITPSLLLSVLSCVLESNLPALPPSRVEQTKLLRLLLLDVLGYEVADVPSALLEGVMCVAEQVRVVDQDWKVTDSFLLGMSSTEEEGVVHKSGMKYSFRARQIEEEEETVFTTSAASVAPEHPRPPSPALSQSTVTITSLRDKLLLSPPLTPRRGRSTLERMRTRDAPDASEVAILKGERMGQKMRTGTPTTTHKSFKEDSVSATMGMGIRIGLESDVETWLEGTRGWESGRSQLEKIEEGTVRDRKDMQRDKKREKGKRWEEMSKKERRRLQPHDHRGERPLRKRHQSPEDVFSSPYSVRNPQPPPGETPPSPHLPPFNPIFRASSPTCVCVANQCDHCDLEDTPEEQLCHGDCAVRGREVCGCDYNDEEEHKTPRANRTMESLPGGLSPLEAEEDLSLKPILLRLSVEPESDDECVTRDRREEGRLKGKPKVRDERRFLNVVGESEVEDYERKKISRMSTLMEGFGGQKGLQVEEEVEEAWQQGPSSLSQLHAEARSSFLSEADVEEKEIEIRIRLLQKKHELLGRLKSLT